MTLKLTPLHPSFVAEVDDVDLSRPLDAGTVRKVEAALDQYGVLVFRKQPLTEDEQVHFARTFGPLDIGLHKARRTAPARFKNPYMVDIANVDHTGAIAAPTHRKVLSGIANQLWHSDSSYQHPRGKYSILAGVVVPESGGETQYADLRAAYDSLPQSLKAEIEELRAEHYALHSRITLLGDESNTEAEKNAIAPAEWPLVQTDPRSGRRALYVGVHARSIVGWPVAQGRMLLMDLIELATQREHVHTHYWEAGDVVMWDNTTTAHRGRRYDLSKRRELRRLTTEEVVVSPERAAMLG